MLAMRILNRTKVLSILGIILLISCSDKMEVSMKSENPMGDTNIIFLHHSTGGLIWLGQQEGFKAMYQKKIQKKSSVELWFEDYNKKNSTKYSFNRQYFPKKEPYGWKNYPYDYYNIWVKNAGEEPYMEEPTLEMLTKDYDVIIWKHCYPVGNIKEDTGNPNIDSEEKRLENYKLQYNALKEKMHSFPDTKFIVWTGAALINSWTNEEEAKRTRAFFDWVKNEWNEESDNIYLWDLYELETEGGTYLKKEYARNGNNPHPNHAFTSKHYPLFCQRVVDVIENNGEKTLLTGEYK